MYKSKALVGLLLVVYILCVIFQFYGNGYMFVSLKSIILPIITLIYFLNVKKKTLFFTLFLVFYSVSDLLVFLKPYTSQAIDYYLGNSLYILSYICLLIEISKSVSLPYILRHFKLHILVLTILNVYIIYVLQVIVYSRALITNAYYLELMYNIVVLMLLSVSLINYFYRDNIKSLYLFLGALCIVFAEVIWVAYTYISERSLLNIVYITLYVLAFYFFFKQSEILYEERDNSNMLLQ
ncbi:hypothetical protein [Mariniflexile sp.]|uniref:hypothetical protein n=1 Tax=Mariniflexile sp. TaxID=1979402 RepID=UPI004048DC54